MSGGSLTLTLSHCGGEGMGRATDLPSPSEGEGMGRATDLPSPSEGEGGGEGETSPERSIGCLGKPRQAQPGVRHALESPLTLTPAGQALGAQALSPAGEREQVCLVAPEQRNGRASPTHSSDEAPWPS